MIKLTLSCAKIRVYIQIADARGEKKAIRHRFFHAEDAEMQNQTGRKNKKGCFFILNEKKVISLPRFGISYD